MQRQLLKSRAKSEIYFFDEKFRKPITDQQLAAMTDLKEGMDSRLKSPALVMPADMKEKIDSFKTMSHWQAVQSIYLNVLKKSQTGAYGINQQEYYDAITKSIDDVNGLIGQEFQFINKSVGVIESHEFNLLRTLFFSIVVVSAALSLLTWYLVRTITLPINRVILNLNSTGKDVHGASTELEGASQQVSSGATQAAASLEETVSSLEELARMVSQNAEQAKKAVEISEASKKSAENGENEMNKLSGAMNDIAVSSKKIEDIINVIDDIAFQTNLLALNAAVEAARAGDQGKGFAVVAEAVRGLAQRSSLAAKDITTLIKDSTQKVNEGKLVAENSAQALKKIVDSVKNIATLIGEITISSQEQDLVHNLAEVTQGTKT